MVGKSLDQYLQVIRSKNNGQQNHSFVVGLPTLASIILSLVLPDNLVHETHITLVIIDCRQSSKQETVSNPNLGIRLAGPDLGDSDFVASVQFGYIKHYGLNQQVANTSREPVSLANSHASFVADSWAHIHSYLKNCLGAKHHSDFYLGLVAQVHILACYCHLWDDSDDHLFDYDDHCLHSFIYPYWYDK